MDKKGYYIHYDARCISGVSKKIDMQLKVLRSMSEVEEVCISLRTKSFFRNALAILPFMSLTWDYSEAYKKIDEADYIYIRSVSYDRLAVRFLRWVKKNNPNCKILCEIPTYPYIKEQFNSVQGAILYPKAWVNRKIIRKYIDRYVLVTDKYDKVDKVKTLSIRNGVDVESVTPVCRNVHDDRIRLVAVAMMQPAHGYERVILGLKEYYDTGGDREIVLNLVGDGSELSMYKELVRKSLLDNRVIFWGEKRGEELNRIYNESDVALDCFGCYKFDLEVASPLKCGEYMAKGLPIVSGVRNENIVDGSTRYFLRVPNTSDSVDVCKIVEFYDSVYSGTDASKVCDQIRELARKIFDISKTFGNVVDYIKG